MQRSTDVKPGTAPTVSFGLPVYNGGIFLSRALDTILAQDFTDFEVVISDNGSTDSTQAICEDYAARDSRIRYVRLETNRGAAYNYNNVFHLSSGRYFKWAAHDDELSPTFLSACLREFERWQDTGTEPSVVYPGADFIDEEGKVTHADRAIMQTRSRFAALRAFHCVQKLSMANPVFGLMPRRALEKTRLIGSFISSDFVLLLELSLLGPIIRVDGALFHRRVHAKMSRLANTSKKDVLAWFDPKANQRLSPAQRVFLEYHRSIWQSGDLGIGSKVMCSLAVTFGVVLRRVRIVQGYYRRRLIQALKGQSGTLGQGQGN